jgi:ubiquitin-activating enzyme E1-like protein 2
MSPSEFSIGDTSGAEFEAYQHGGIARQLKQPKTVTFESLEKQLSSPQYIFADFAKMEAPLQIHVAMLALDQFTSENNHTPRPR